MDLVACPTVEVEALALVIGMQSGAVMAASVFLVELPHGIVVGVRPEVLLLLLHLSHLMFRGL